MHRVFACLLTLFFVILIGCNILGQTRKPIAIDVMPIILSCTDYQRIQVRVRMTVDPNENNRYLHFAYASDVGESGSSVQELDDRSAITYTRIVSVNCNYYLFTACVLRTQGKRFCARQEVKPP